MRNLVSLFTVLLFACAVSLVRVASVSAQCPSNAVVNAGFEDGYSERGAGEVVVANGWHPWWQEGPHQEDGLNRRPEYKGEDASRFGQRRVRSGNWAQKMFTTYSTHHAGIYQQINVQRDSVVTVSAWAQAWGSQEDNPETSVGGKYETSVGIDPTGGTDHASPNIVWSDRNGTLDQWVELRVQAKAQAETVTIYLRGDCEWRTKHNDAYFDDVCVSVVAPTPLPTRPPTATPEPEPTDEPTPDAPDAEETEIEEESPTRAPEPTDSVVPSPTPTSTSTPVLSFIGVTVFEDSNGDGVRGAGERQLAGARVALQDASRKELAVVVSDGASPVRFEDLPVGTYYVVSEDPPGYSSTSPNQWGVVLGGQGPIVLSFGDRVAPSPTVVAVETATPSIVADEREPGDDTTAQGRGIAGISGILVAFVALALPVSLRVLKERV